MPAGFHCMSARSLLSSRWHFYSGLYKGCFKLWTVWGIYTTHQPDSVIVWLRSLSVSSNQCWGNQPLLRRPVTLHFLLARESGSLVTQWLAPLPKCRRGQDLSPCLLCVRFACSPFVSVGTHVQLFYILQFSNTKQRWGGLETTNCPQVWISVSQFSDGLASRKLFPGLTVCFNRFQLLMTLAQ